MVEDLDLNLSAMGVPAQIEGISGGCGMIRHFTRMHQSDAKTVRGFDERAIVEVSLVELGGDAALVERAAFLDESMSRTPAR